jgi:hypothetical protein
MTHRQPQVNRKTRKTVWWCKLLSPFVDQV